MSITKGTLNLAKKGLGAAALGSGAAGFGMDLGMNLHSGDDLGTAAVKAGVTGVLTASNPILYGTIMTASMGVDAYWGLQQFNHQKKQWWQKQYGYDNRVGGNYQDTQRAMTMRQAAVQAIQGSKLNARSALGGEAKILNPYSRRMY